MRFSQSRLHTTEPGASTAQRPARSRGHRHTLLKVRRAGFVHRGAKIAFWIRVEAPGLVTLQCRRARVEQIGMRQPMTTGKNSHRQWCTKRDKKIATHNGSNND